jgi:hypothetical protein
MADCTAKSTSKSELNLESKCGDRDGDGDGTGDGDGDGVYVDCVKLNGNVVFGNGRSQLLVNESVDTVDAVDGRTIVIECGGVLFRWADVVVTQERCPRFVDKEKRTVRMSLHNDGVLEVRFASVEDAQRATRMKLIPRMPLGMPSSCAKLATQATCVLHGNDHIVICPASYKDTQCLHVTVVGSDTRLEYELPIDSPPAHEHDRWFILDASLDNGLGLLVRRARGVDGAVEDLRGGPAGGPMTSTVLSAILDSRVRSSAFLPMGHAVVALENKGVIRLPEGVHTVLQGMTLQGMGAARIDDAPVIVGQRADGSIVVLNADTLDEVAVIPARDLRLENVETRTNFRTITSTMTSAMTSAMTSSMVRTHYMCEHIVIWEVTGRIVAVHLARDGRHRIFTCNYPPNLSATVGRSVVDMVVYGDGGVMAVLSNSDVITWRIDLDGRHVSRASMCSSRLASSQLASARLASSQLASSQLASSQLASAQLASAQLASSQLASSQLASAQLASAQLASSRLASSQLASAQLASAMERLSVSKRPRIKEVEPTSLVSLGVAQVTPLSFVVCEDPCMPILLYQSPQSKDRSVMLHILQLPNKD